MKAGGKTVTMRVITKSRTTDGAGGATTADVTAGRIRFRVVPLAGLEQQIADQQTVRATHRLYGRYRSYVTTAHWLEREDDGRQYDIAEVINVRDANREMVLLAIERKAA